MPDTQPDYTTGLSDFIPLNSFNVNSNKILNDYDNSTKNAFNNNQSAYESKMLDFNKQVQADRVKQNTFNNNMSKINTGINFGMDLLNTWNNFKQLSLQKKEFAFNKDMATKQFNLAKDSYERQKKRSQGIADFYKN